MSGKRNILVAVLVALTMLAVAAIRPAGAESSSDLKLDIPPQQEKLVALTFDDGPHPEHTAALLDGLKARGIRATFFLVGSQVELAPELVERMVRDGHQIGLHTLGHVRVDGISKAEFDRQVEEERRLLFRLVGERQLWLRPPYGIMDDHTAGWAAGPIILWSVDPEDWKDGNSKRIADHIVEHVRSGDIVLLHDIYPSSVEAALETVDRLQKEGWQFLTVEQLIGRSGKQEEAGRVYRRVAVGAPQQESEKASAAG